MRVRVPSCVVDRSARAGHFHDEGYDRDDMEYTDAMHRLVSGADDGLSFLPAWARSAVSSFDEGLDSFEDSLAAQQDRKKAHGSSAHNRIQRVAGIKKPHH